MYKNYIFDLYGTLVDINTNEYKNYLWEKMVEIYGFEGANYTTKELKKAYFEQVEIEKENVKRLHPEFTNIDIQIEKVFENLLKIKGIEPPKNFSEYSAKMFRAISTKYIKLYDGVIELLQLLKSKNKRVYLLTNAQRGFTAPEIKMLGIEKYFDGIIISSDEYTCKPDKYFYNVLFERYGVKPEESIMIGNDCHSDIMGAYGVGMDSLYIHTNISPDVDIELKSKFNIMDGDIKKIKDLIIIQ